MRLRFDDGGSSSSSSDELPAATPLPSLEVLRGVLVVDLVRAFGEVADDEGPEEGLLETVLVSLRIFWKC